MVEWFEAGGGAHIADHIADHITGVSRMASKTKPKVHRLDRNARPWERQTTENDRHWKAFLAYRDAGEEHRSLRQTATTANEHTTQVGRWSVGYRWRERVLAYDRSLDEERVRVARREVAKMAERHAQLASAGLGALQQPVAEFVRRINEKQVDLTKMSDRDLLSFIRTSAAAVKDFVGVERVARGAPSDVVGTIGATAPAKTITDAIDEMFRKAGFDVDGLPVGEDPDDVDGINGIRADLGDKAIPIDDDEARA